MTADSRLHAATGRNPRFIAASDATPGGFDNEGYARLMDLRGAIASTLLSVGADVEEPQEISRKFGLDKTLAWKLSRLVLEKDALASVVHAPRLPGLVLFEKAMAKGGASDQALVHLRIAIEGFEAFVEAHAGDRDVMEIMITTPHERASANVKRLEQYRKDGFLANSATWGVSTKVHLAIRWVLPSSSPGQLDLVTVCGFVAFRRLRSDVPWTVASLYRWNAAGLQPPVPFESLGGTSEIPLLADFCSEPLPALRAERESEIRSRVVIEPGPVGNAAAADIVLGWVHRGFASLRATHQGEMGEHGALLSTPAELLIHDLYLHRSLGINQSPTASLYGMMPGGPQYPMAEGATVPPQMLPVPTEVAPLSVGQPTPEVPAYAGLVHRVLALLGQQADDFAGYRLRVKYPPIPSTSVLKHPLQP